MAEVAASLLVTPVVEMAIKRVSSLIEKEFSAIYGVEEDVRNLSSKFTAIQAVLKSAEDGQVKHRDLKDWLEKLRDVAYDAEDILDAFSTQVQLRNRKELVRFRPHFCASKVFFHIDIAHKINKLLTRLDMIHQEKEQFHGHIIDSVPGTQNHKTPISLPVHNSDVVGRGNDRNRIVELLKSDESDREGEVSVIPIIGIGGLGKTTLAELIYNDERVKHCFDFRMWVRVSVNFDLSRILKAIMDNLRDTNFHTSPLGSRIDNLQDLKSDTDFPTTLVFRIQEYLAGKKFLLVLDDVWTENYMEWEPLKSILRQGKKGSKVLVTSRSAKVSQMMGVQAPYELAYLPEPECWSLFKRIAFTNDNLSSGELEQIGRDIVSKCHGLPLAVKAMACVLRGNVDVKKWKRILTNDIWDAEKHTPSILPALQLSYHNLPSYLRQCFAFCSLFPKAHIFKKEELVKLWVAEGFIQSSPQERAEETGSEYFDELVMRSFFQPSDDDNDKNYRMHDLIHDLATLISSPYYYQEKDTNSSDRLRHASLLCKDAEQPLVKIIDTSKRLRTLLFPHDHLKDFKQQTLDKIFRTMTYIRVLDLSSSTILQLPQSIEKLKLLRYLDLSKTEIRMLPESICNLWNLQTLKLLGCVWLSQLPRDLGKLIHLMHLELDEIFWYNAPAMPPRMGKLTLLHNLHAFQIGSAEDGCGIKELKDMKNLTGTLHILKLENAANAEEAKLTEKTCLDKLVLEWSNRDTDPEDQAAEERVLEDLQPHSNLDKLQICHYRGTRLPVWMRDGLFEKLVTVSLKHCTNCRVLSLGRLPNLRRLCIKGMQELEVWPEEEFPSLVRLKISNCPKLRKLPSCFPGLQVLKIKKCDSLKAFAVPTGCMSSLILVNNRVLEDWQEPVRISSDDERISSDDEHISNDDERISNEDERISNDDALISSDDELLEFPPEFIRYRKPLALYDFLELKIICCPKLPALPQLLTTKLEISGCELLTAFPDSGLFEGVEHLVLDEATLVKAIPVTRSLISLVISNISNATSLPKWPHLPELKALYIHHCKDLVSLSQEAAPLQRLTSLQLLSIESCPELVSLPDEGLPKKLECLMIGSCPNFESLGPNDVLKGLTSLKDLYIEDCPKLKCLPEEGVSTSLQHLVIQGCPLLMEQCRKEGGGGPYWSKIMHIPDLEISSINASSTFGRSVPWYHRLACCQGQ